MRFIVITRNLEVGVVFCCGCGPRGMMAIFAFRQKRASFPAESVFRKRDPMLGQFYLRERFVFLLYMERLNLPAGAGDTREMLMRDGFKSILR